MTFPAEVDTVPLKRWDDGSIRVGDTRVMLEFVIDLWMRGESPEGIVDSFPTLELEDVYSVIAYFLRHRGDVEDYVAVRSRVQEEALADLQRRFPQEGLRAKLLQRRSRGS